MWLPCVFSISSKYIISTLDHRNCWSLVITTEVKVGSCPAIAGGSITIQHWRCQDQGFSSTTSSKFFPGLLRGSQTPRRRVLVSAPLLFLRLDKIWLQSAVHDEQSYHRGRQAPPCAGSSGYTGSGFHLDQWSRFHPRQVLCQTFQKTWHVTWNLDE